MTETAAESTPPPAESPYAGAAEIVAPPSSWERKKFLIITLGCFFWSVWSLRDGYLKYPAENQAAIEEAQRQGKPAPEKLPHGGYDIPLNRIIGWGLLPVGAFLLFRTFHRSRGVYRLDGTTLHVPGHPPVPFDAIRSIDPKKWRRKGIAFIEYEVDGKPGRLKLDDYIYEQDPTDAIYKRILAAVAPDDLKALEEEEQRDREEREAKAAAKA